MRKKLLKLLFWIIILIVTILVLNIKVSTRQGINYSVATLKIPLYLKVLNFFDRHYNYKLITERIIKDSTQEEAKVLEIFAWTYENIRKAPEGYPIIDDHVWHIIVRGYGVNDQSSDVFTTLCNYANMEAFYALLFTQDRSSSLPISFVKVNKRWVVFDPYSGVYFRNRKGDLADIEEINKGDWLIEKLNTSDAHDVEYVKYFENIIEVKNSGFSRANTQSPINRLKYEVKKRLSSIRSK